jgi:hypothetical protein
MNNLEYFEKGLNSAIEDYNEKYSSFMDGFFSSLTEDDIIKLGGWKNIVSAVGKVFKKQKPGFNIISPQRVIKGVEGVNSTPISSKALRKGKYMTAKEPPRKVYKPKAPTAPTVEPVAPAAPEAAPAATKSNFGKGLKWGIGGLGAGIAATSAYNAYKNKNRDQQQEPYYGY